MTQVKLFGYSDKISVKPGDVIRFHVSADGADIAAAQLVRLIHGDESTGGPGFIEEEVDCATNGSWHVEKQYTQLGSFLTVEDPARLLALDKSLTVCAFIFPTKSQAGHVQSLIGRWDDNEKKGFCLGITQSGRLQFRVGNGDGVENIESNMPLQPHMWYFVAASLDAKTGRATLYHEGVRNRYNSRLSRVALAG